MGDEIDVILNQFSTTLDIDQIFDNDNGLDEDDIGIERAVPSDVIINDKGHVILVDCETASLMEFDRNGQFLRKAGHKHLTSAWGVLKTNSGKIVVSDPASHDLKVFSRSGQYLMNSEYGSHLIEPYGIAYHPTTAQVAVCDRSACCVYIHGADGTVADILKVDQSEEVPPMKCPSYVAFARSGGTVVSDMESNCLYSFDEKGDLQWTFGADCESHSLSCPCGVSVDDEGTTLVADSENSRVVMVGSGGQYLGYALTWADGLAEPRALRLDGDKLIITEATSGYIKVFDYTKLKVRKQNSVYQDQQF